MTKTLLFLLKIALFRQMEKEKNLRDIYKTTMLRIQTTNDDDEPGFLLVKKNAILAHILKFLHLFSLPGMAGNGILDKTFVAQLKV